ncbi:MAG TPA: peptidyl-prolyl cis-trans isomerase [Solirubrobacteraceae bacterium]|nr:peptidyl-prolyl cis-trans isomerase [Solirubrobacteraceae bacterium]
MPRFARVSLALGAFFIAAIVLSACGGNNVPGNAVANVDGTLITTQNFNHWLAVAARSQNPAGGAVSVPDAPTFAKCIAAKKASQPKPVNGQKPPTDAQLKTQCQQQYTSLRDQVMQFLISAQWIMGEASDQGVKVSDANVNKRFQATKKQSFPKDSDYQKFLTQSGMTQDDILFRVKLDALSNAIRNKVTKGQGKVTQAQITTYYNKNKKRFAQPERRDLRIVLTKTPAQAQAAKKALDSGQSWKVVAKKYSTDASTKNTGGQLLAVTRGQQDRTFENAAFAAKTNKVLGPVKTQFGYYVFDVSKITPAAQQSLAQAKSTIQQLLSSQTQQKALNDFVKDFQKKWKDRTNCRKGFITQDCSNAPKQKAQPTTATPQAGGATPQAGAGATPQGGASATPQAGGAAPQTAAPQTGGAAPQTAAPQTAAPQTAAPQTSTGG